jgi:hypothetical protein
LFADTSKLVQVRCAARQVSAGFKWHQLDRQPDKHWLLWLGDATAERHSFASYEDIGIELAPCWWKNHKDEDAGDIGQWFCWLRNDSAGRYHRFIHIRHLHTVGELILLIEAITGQGWDPTNNLYGSMRKPEDAERVRKTDALAVRPTDHLGRRQLA